MVSGVARLQTLEPVVGGWLGRSLANAIGILGMPSPSPGQLDHRRGTVCRDLGGCPPRLWLQGADNCPPAARAPSPGLLARGNSGDVA